jgi:hypothetical protein
MSVDFSDGVLPGREGALGPEVIAFVRDDFAYERGRYSLRWGRRWPAASSERRNKRVTAAARSPPARATDQPI